MEAKVNEVEINGAVYVPKGESLPMAEKHDNLDYCIVRTYSAGVFAGYCDRKGDEAKIYNARRIWFWDGAASLSQLAVDGTSKPDKCKFPCSVDSITVLGVLEVIPCTEKAQKSIQEVKIWQQ